MINKWNVIHHTTTKQTNFYVHKLRKLFVIKITLFIVQYFFIIEIFIMKSKVLKPKSAAMIAALFFISSWSYAETKVSKEHEACVDKIDFGAMKNSQFEACYIEELKRQDRKLNEVYRSVQGKISLEAKAELIKGQRSWIAYRDNWCNYELALNLAPSGEVNRLMCAVYLTIAQTNKLRESAP